MKGSSPPTAIWLAVTMLAVNLPIALFGSSYLGSLENEIQRDDIRFLTVELTGVFNLMQTAPDGSEHTTRLSRENCKINIKDNILTISKRVGVIDFSVSLPIIKTDTIINEIDLETEDDTAMIICDPNKIELIIKKDNNEITYLYASD